MKDKKNITNNGQELNTKVFKSLIKNVKYNSIPNIFYYYDPATLVHFDVNAKYAIVYFADTKKIIKDNSNNFSLK